MPKKKINPEVSEAAAELGRAGGRNGKGDAKTRPAQHYRRMAAIRQQNRIARLLREK